MDAAWGMVMYSVGDPYRVSRQLPCDGARTQAAPSDGELLRVLHRGCPGTDMKW